LNLKNYKKLLISKGHFGGVPRPAQVPKLLRMKSNIYDKRINS